jgi:uncharacterized protein YggT (Ycf19 family)
MQPAPSAPVLPTQPGQASELTRPSPGVQPIQPTHPIWPVQPAEPVHPVEPFPPVQAAALPRGYYVDASVERLPAVSLTSRAPQILYLALGMVEALMITRVVLKLLAANADVGFVRFVYGVSAPLVAPFQGIFSTPVSHTNVLELSSLVALAVYALVAWGIVRLIFILGRQPGTATPTRHRGVV